MLLSLQRCLASNSRGHAQQTDYNIAVQAIDGETSTP